MDQQFTESNAENRGREERVICRKTLRVFDTFPSSQHHQKFSGCSHTCIVTKRVFLSTQDREESNIRMYYSFWWGHSNHYRQFIV